MIYVAQMGFKSTTQTVNSLELMEPLQGLNKNILQAISYYKLIGLSTTDHAIELLDKVKSVDEEFTKNMASLAENSHLPNGVPLADLRASYDKISSTGKDMALAFIEDNQEKGKSLALEIEKLEQVLTHEVREITKLISGSLLTSSVQSRDFLKGMRTAGGVMMALALMFALINIYSVVISVKKALRDEARQLTDKISNVVTALLHGSNELSHNSDDLSKSSSTLSSSSKAQTQASKNAVSAIEKITSLIDEANQSASNSLDLSRDNDKKVKEGRQIIEQMHQAIKEIQDSNGELQLIIKLISEISEKTRVINDIVFQTRLLSFNASVEAARAGEHGKGFAVVAEEIGQLSQLSGNSAVSINQLVSTSSQKVSEVVSLIQEKVSTGRIVADEVVNIFGEIETRNNDMNRAVEMIHAATNQQAKGVHETSLAISEIDSGISVTHEITEKSQIISRSIEEKSKEILKTTQNLNSIISLEADDSVTSTSMKNMAS